MGTINYGRKRTWEEVIKEYDEKKKAPVEEIQIYVNELLTFYPEEKTVKKIIGEWRKRTFNDDELRSLLQRASKQIWQKDNPEHKGFPNTGLTCYVNVILQCLKYTPGLLQKIETAPGSKSNTLQSLLNSFRQPNSINHFIELLGRKMEQNLNQMNDPLEFMEKMLFPILENDIGNTITKLFSFGVKDDPEDDEYSLCHLQISVKTSVQEALNQTEQFKITNSPQFAIFRTNFGQYEINLEQFVDLKPLKSDGNEDSYEIYAIVVFRGQHYLAIVKDKNNWWRINDEQVCPEYDPLYFTDEKPLLLFYKKTNTKSTAQGSMQQTNTSPNLCQCKKESLSPKINLCKDCTLRELQTTKLVQESSTQTENQKENVEDEIEDIIKNMSKLTLQYNIKESVLNWLDAIKEVKKKENGYFLPVKDFDACNRLKETENKILKMMEEYTTQKMKELL